LFASDTRNPYSKTTYEYSARRGKTNEICFKFLLSIGAR
jgi:hypothetical protein